MGIFDSFLGLNKYYIPYGMTPKDRARELLDRAKYYTAKTNRSFTVSDFSGSYKNLMNTIDELIWINEKKRIAMYPSPRSERNKIRRNSDAIMNDFIGRALSVIPDYENDRYEKIKSIFIEIRDDDTISSLIGSETEKRMSRILDEEDKKRKIHDEQSLLDSVGINQNLDLYEIDAMKVVEALEHNIQELFSEFYKGAFSAERGEKMFSDFKNACYSSRMPLMAEIRLNSLLDEYEKKFKSPNQMSIVDCMSGHDFEQWCASLISKNGFQNVEVTPSSGDQGVDITAEKDGVFYAIQCKCYSSDLGNKPVQEVYAGKEMYNCQVGAVMTNRYFTEGAKALAKQTRVLLWDRDKIQEMIQASMN